MTIGAIPDIGDNAEIVRILEEFLMSARMGKFTGLAIVASNNRGQLSMACSGALPGVIIGTERLHNDMLDMLVPRKTSAIAKPQGGG